MRLHHPIRRARIAAIAAAIVASSVSAFGQSGQSRLSEIAKSAAAGLALQPGETLRRLSIDEAVKLGLEQNLGIQIQRSTRRFRTPAIAQARSFWAPQFSTTFTRASNEQPVVNIFSGSAAERHERAVFHRRRRSSETLPWGANYTANWNNSRFTTNDPSNTFNPRLQSNLLLNFTQPLLRNRSIDQIRQQVANSRKFRDLSDIQLDSVIVQTTRAVRNAYWDLSATINNLKAQQESLALAQQSLADNQQAGRDRHAGADRHRAGAGRSREQRRARDRRRSADQAGAGQPARADSRPVRRRLLDDGVRAERRRAVPGAGDRHRRRGAKRARQAGRPAVGEEQPSSAAISNIQYLRNQILPDVNAQVNYGAIGVGGVQLPVTQPVDRRAHRSLDPIARGFGSALGDVFRSSYPQWTFGVQIGYPLGASTAHANLARARLEYQQSQTQLKNIELQVATQVRDVGPQRPDQPEAGAVGARVARAAGEEARSGRKEAGGRHVDQLLRLPGAARSLAGAHRRKSRRSPTTTSRWSTSKPCSWRRSTATRLREHRRPAVIRPAPGSRQHRQQRQHGHRITGRQQQ